MEAPSPPKVSKEKGETGKVEGGLVAELRIATVMLVPAPIYNVGEGDVKLKV